MPRELRVPTERRSDMIDISGIDDFHDSNLLAVDLHLATRRLSLRLDAYLSLEPPRTRQEITVRFRNVRAFSATIDLQELASHARFGNIAHWSPSEGFNLVSLAAGAITFEAEGFEIERVGQTFASR